MKYSKEQILKTNCFEDNEYLDKYIQLIDNNKDTLKEKYITQQHHIIPKCYFKLLNLELDENEDNKIHLKYADHILAHYYLFMCCKENICLKHLLGNISYKQVKKFQNQHIDIDKNTETYILSNIDNYNELYYEFSIQNKYWSSHPVTDKTKQKLREMHLGKKASPEAKQKMSAYHKQQIISDEQKEKLHLKFVGRKPYYDANNKIHYYYPEKGESIPQGCTAGLPPQTIKNIKEKAGFKKGSKPWNTGNPTPEEIKRKISEANTGKKRSEETKHKLSEALKKAPHRKHTEEEKQHLSKMSKDRIWINNGIFCKMVKQDKLDEFLSLGFVLGRLKFKK